MRNPVSQICARAIWVRLMTALGAKFCCQVLALCDRVTRLRPTMYFDFLTLVIPLLVVVTIVLQVIASIRVYRDSGFEPEQRRAQMWFVWLVPIFGAATVLAVLHEDPVALPEAPEQDIERVQKLGNKVSDVESNGPKSRI